jgi:L-alanine-DL-glutamate epimerase-like enolase superfamily enzyme
MPLVRRAEASLINYKLEKTVGGSGVAAVDVIVVEMEDSDGATGLGLSYVLGGGNLALRSAQAQIESFVLNQNVPPPRALWNKIVRSFNRTGLGPNLIGLGAIDVACWDMHARRQKLPLAVAMGGEPRSVPVYGSGEFNTQQKPEEAAEVARKHVARGFTAVKPRVSGKPVDAKVLAAVRDAVGADTFVMADANEKCDLAAAQWLMNVASDLQLLFVEEPLPATSIDAYAKLAKTATMAIAAGEHLQDLRQMTSLLSSGIVSVIQPDLAMVGGLTPTLDLAIVAEQLNASVSPHFLPGLFVHVAGASSSVRWLEDFPLLEPLFDGWPVMDSSGNLRPTDAAGHGLVLSDRAKKLIGK